MEAFAEGFACGQTGILFITIDDSDGNNVLGPTSADIITLEKERLEKKILELEQKPLEFFGSQQNKRVRIGYYEYRLQTLMADPDSYFKNPEPFEGNVPVPDKVPSN